MAEIIFDKLNERVVNHGISRCVIATDTGVYPWNGIAAIEERNNELKGEYVHIDGVRVDYSRPNQDKDYTIKCYTYPGIIESLLGYVVTSGGALVKTQSKKTCHLAWMTENIDALGTRSDVINILFNVQIHEPNTNSVSFSSSNTAELLSFETSVIPIPFLGGQQFKISIDSRRSDENTFKTILGWLYGTPAKNPSWPTPDRLFDLIDNRRSFNVGGSAGQGLFQLVSGNTIIGSTSIGIYKITNASNIRSVDVGLYEKV